MGNNSEHRRSRGQPPISPDQLSQLATRLFNPNLKSPRIHYATTPPSLSMSRLQPHAEIDERPYYRIRRFRTWNNAAPPVRLALLDPRRRGHLRRYQTFATPNIGIITRGQFVTLYDPSARPRAKVLIPRPLVLPVSPIPAPGMPKVKLTRTERKARYARLLQFKFTLDQEHERRFRKGMRMLMAYAIEFEKDNTVPSGDWSTGKDLWRPDANVLEMEQWTQFYRDIRKKSQNIYHYLQETDINPVPRRDELKKAVKAEEDRRAVNRERKHAKKRAREDEAERLRQESLAKEQESAYAKSALSELLEQKALLQGLIDREEDSNNVEEPTADQLEEEQFVDELIDMMSDTASEPDDQLRTPIDAKPNRLFTHDTDIDHSDSIRGSMVYKTDDSRRPSYEVHNEMAQSLAAMIMDMQKQSSRNQSSGLDDNGSESGPISRHSAERGDKKKRTLIVIRSPKGVDNATLARLLPQLLGPASRENQDSRPRLRPSGSSEYRRTKGDDPAVSIPEHRFADLGDLQEVVEPSASDLPNHVDRGCLVESNSTEVDTVDRSAVTDLGRIASLNMDDDTAIPGLSQDQSVASTRGTSSLGWSDASTVASSRPPEEFHEISAEDTGELDKDTMTGVSVDGDTLPPMRPSRAVARAW